MFYYLMLYKMTPNIVAQNKNHFYLIMIIWVRNIGRIQPGGSWLEVIYVAVLLENPVFTEKPGTTMVP